MKVTNHRGSIVCSLPYSLKIAPLYAILLNETNLFLFINLLLSCTEIVLFCWFPSLILFLSCRMKRKGSCCSVLNCSKRRKFEEDGSEIVRSDSDGSEDDESQVKRVLPRMFQKLVPTQMSSSNISLQKL